MLALRFAAAMALWVLPAKGMPMTPIDQAPSCTPPLGAQAISVFITQLENTSGSVGSQARLDFQLGSPGSPITSLTVNVNGVAVDAPVTGANLNKTGGIWFTTPSVAGTYPVTLTAANAAGCSTTASKDALGNLLQVTVKGGATTPPTPPTTPSVTGPDPIEPRYVANTAMARVKTPQQQMHYTAGLPIRFMADSGNPAIWWCPPGHPPYVCGHHVDFLVDGAIVGTQYDSDPAEQATGWQFILANGLPVGDHILTVVFTAHDPTANVDYPPVAGLVPVTIHVDPMPTHGTVLNLAQDIVLTGSAPLTWADTTVIGNGHAVTAAAGYSGAVTISNSFITGLANYNAYGIDVTTTGDCDFESTIWEATAMNRLNCANVKAGAGNEFRSSNKVTLQLSNPDASPVLDLTASVSGTVVGMNSALGIVKVSGPVKWQVGGLGPNDGVVIMGPRGVLQVNSGGCVVQGLYDHHDYSGAWSQGFNLEGNGQDSTTSCLVEHSLMRGGSWPLQSLGNEVRFSVVIDDGGHASWRTPLPNTKIHHNIFNYVAGPNSGFSGMIQDYKGYGGFEIFNNDFDAGGAFAQYNNSTVRTGPGSVWKSFRSNVVQNFSDVAASATPVGSVAGDPNGLQYADYNLWNNPLITAATPHYSPGLVTPGGHEKTMAPLFTGTLDSPYLVDEGLIWLRKLSVWQVLGYFRKKNTPQSGSPLLGAGDPADGPNNPIGAIGACDASDQLGRLNVPDPCGTTSPATHPSIWTDRLAAAKRKVASGTDPDWPSQKAAADNLLQVTVPSTYDPSAFGGYAGDWWGGAISTLAQAYQLTGNAAYAAKAIEVLKVLAAAGVAPVQPDSGYSTRNIPNAIAIGLDWLADQLDATTKAALIAAGNAQYDWAVKNALDCNLTASPFSNYLGGCIDGFGLFALGSKGDNPRAAEIGAYVRSLYDGLVVPALQTGPMQSCYPAEGYTYGLNHLVRLLAYTAAVQSATGEPLAAPLAQRCGRSLAYAWKPNRWQFPDEADYAGNFVGIPDPSAFYMIPTLAPGNADAGLAQFIALHSAPNPAGLTNSASRFFWFDPTASATDVVTLSPCFYSVGDEHEICTDRSLWTSMRGTIANLAGHAIHAAGHIEMQRGPDNLLLYAGQCKGTTDCVGGDPQVMEEAARGANTLSVFTPWTPVGYYGGGQGVWDTNHTLAHGEAATYGYECIDMTGAYTARIATGLGKALRCAVTLLDVGTMVVYDHVETGTATGAKLMFHLPQAAALQGSGQAMQATVGASTLQLRIFSPQALSFSPARDSWNDGTTPLPGAPCTGAQPYPAAYCVEGAWTLDMTYRLDVPLPASADVITVLSAYAAGGTPPAIASSGPLSVQVGARTVTFTADASGVTVK